MQISNVLDSLNELIKDKKNVKNFKIEEIEVNKINYFFKDRDENFKNDIAFAELVESIKENGLLQPVVVFKTLDNRFYKIAGGRRIEAFKVLEIEKIPALIIPEEDFRKEEILKLILEENKVRADISNNEETEFLLKALAITFDINLLDEKNENKLIEIGKKYLTQIAKLHRKENLTEEETNMMLTWDIFSKKYKLTFRKFYDDVKLYSLKEPFVKFYNKYKVFTKKETLNINKLLKKNKEVFFALKMFFTLIDEKLKKEGEISEKLKKSMKQLLNDVLKNQDLIKAKITDKELISSFEKFDIDEKTLYLLIFLKLLYDFTLDEITNNLNILENNNQKINEKIKKIFESIDLENMKINLEENKKIEKEIKKKIRKINRLLKQIDLENIELEGLNKKIDELLNFLKKEGEKNEKNNK